MPETDNDSHELFTRGKQTKKKKKKKMKQLQKIAQVLMQHKYVRSFLRLRRFDTIFVTIASPDRFCYEVHSFKAMGNSTLFTFVTRRRSLAL